MSILKYKYQAHKLINYIFYIVVFCIGFVIGFTSKNIDINKILSNVLFIDNVSAYEMTLSDDTVVTETDILNAVRNTKQDFNFDLYPNVLCDTRINNSGYFECVFLQNEIIPLISVFNDTDGGWQHYKVFSNLSDSIYNNMYFILSCPSSLNYCTIPGYSSFSFYQLNNLSLQRIYSNFNLTNTSLISSSDLKRFNKFINKLDFITPQLNYNENLFANNNDFKQVCVESNKRYVISATDYYDDHTIFSDFIWFPYDVLGLKDGVYHTKDQKLIEFEEDYHYFFKDVSSINKHFNKDTGLTYLLFSLSSSYPYESRYNYFGWSAFPFTVDYDKTGDSLPVFWFNSNSLNIQPYNLFSSGGGAGSYFGEEEQVTELCFYINKLYDVQELEEDDNGNFHASVSSPKGDIIVSSIKSNNFFSDFDSNTFGLNTIITSPLIAIQSISNGTCSPQTISILNKDITLPCGNTIFWDRQDVSSFKIFWNMLWGGIICYGIGVSLFRLVLRIKNPNNDKIEVLDL